ncbi:MAG: glycosyltransferase, partial [Nevskiales bacterium]
ETRVLRQADRINIVSDGFLSHVRSKAPQVDVRSFTNGIDDEFLNLDFSTQSKKAQSPDLPLIVYAGNIGEGQGLHAIVPQAAQALEGRARIRIIGDGGRKQALADRLQAMQLPNVELLDPVPRQALLEHYREADVLFLHLNDYAAFHKVLPSKIFEYAATAKSMLAGVGGFAAEFLRKEVAGAEVFDPCDADGMVEAFETLEPGAVISRDAFCEKYARAKIMAHMAADILSLGELRNS